MVDYSTWTERMEFVTNLQLDGRNPRIPGGGAGPDQRELIADLVAHDKVYDLARDIVEVGFYPLESLVGLKEDGKSIILEGNRRLAALKLLVSPEQAPEAEVKRFRTLAGRVALDGIKRVRVLYAPSREAAAPLILQKHTREQIERWSPLMQAKFYRSLADSGITIEEMARRYARPAGEIARFLRLDEMYEIACAITLPEEARVRVHNPRDFRAAVLERLLDIPTAREFLGIEFDSAGRVRGIVPKEEFAKAYRKILTDIAAGSVDTRTLNTVKEAAKYLAAISKHGPDRTRKGTFTADDFLRPSASAQKDTPKPKPEPRTAKSKSVIPLGTKCNVQNQRIKDVFRELRRLAVADYPNASAVLLRILLELCIGHYLDKTGRIKPLLAKATTKGKPADWYPTLRQLLSATVQDPTVNLTPLARKRLQQFLSKQNSIVFVDDLDGFVHNRYAIPTEQEIRAIWETLDGVFAVVLEEPPPPAPAKPQKK